MAIHDAQMHRGFRPSETSRAKAPPTIQRLSGGCRIDRHVHAERYAAVVLRGGYVESGTLGRVEAEPGTVLIHPAYSAHMDLIRKAGASVLNLPLPGPCNLPRAFRIEDPDRVAIAAEASLTGALRLLRPHASVVFLNDWPDELARVLALPASPRLQDWAQAHGLNPASLSRGFRRVFGTTPQRFRAESRALAAVMRLTANREPLAEIAAREGFADQAHMTRAVKSLTGSAPLRLREAKPVQDSESSPI